jgi:hypothetical protein
MKNKTAQQLKEEFLERAAPLMDQYLDATFGIDSIQSTDSACRKEVWELLKEFIQKADEKIYLPEDFSGTPEGVIRAVESGHITLQEGEKLLLLYRTAKAIETMGDPDALNQTYIPQLNIYTNPKKIGDTDGEN